MVTEVDEGLPEPIALAELQRRLGDISVPDADLRPYLMEAAGDSGSFRPQVRINPAAVERAGSDVGMAEAAVLLASLNGVARWRRHERYRRKLKNWRGLRIVSEGDSWFQYPFLLDDVIDQLWDDYAIFSLDAAGDLLTDMVKQGEVIAAVIAERPDVVLLSGGGNDLLGEARLARVLPPFDPKREARDYLGDLFEAHLATVLKAYEEVVQRVRAAAADTAIVLHTYDYALPNAGRWLGKPMASIGIVDTALQRAIVRCCIDRFEIELGRMAARHANIALVDCRGAVDAAQWHDELHPTSGGFASVAWRFRTAIAKALGHEGGVEAAPTLRPADGEPGKAEDLAAAAIHLSKTYSDTALLHELGRREAIAGAGGEVDELGSLSIPEASVEAAFPVFREAGKRIVDALHRQLFRLICGRGKEDVADRKAIADALKVGGGALVGVVATTLGALAVPAGVAAIAAPILARRILSPTVEALCDTWSEALGEPRPPVAEMKDV